MALSFVDYVGDGSTTAFAVPFPYLLKTHVSVAVDGNPTGFVWQTNTSIVLTPAPPAGSSIRVQRNSSRNARIVNFTNIGSLSSEILNTASQQEFNLAVEAYDAAVDALDQARDYADTISVQRATQAAQNVVAATVTPIWGQVPLSVGSQAQNLIDILKRHVSIEDYGALCNGTTDDAAALQAAINDTTVGTIHLPAKRIKIGAVTIPTGRIVNIVGEGFKTVLVPASGSQGFMLKVQGGPFCQIVNITFDATALGAGNTVDAIKVPGSACWIFGCQFYWFHAAVHLQGNNLHWLRDCNISSATSFGIIYGGAGQKVGDTTLENIEIQNGNWQGVGIACYTGANALYCHSVRIVTYNIGIDIADNQSLGGGYIPEYLWFWDCNVDPPKTAAVQIQNGRHISFDGTHLSSDEGQGLVVNGGVGIRFADGEIVRCGQNGVVINAGLHVDILDSTIACNSYNSAKANVASQYDGVVVAGGVTDFRIIGNRITNNVGLSETQRYGVQIAAGAGDRFSVSDNYLAGNALAPFVDNSTGASKTLSDNIFQGPPVLRQAPNAAQANGILVSGGATGQDVGIAAQGTDANISMNIVAKGQGRVSLTSNGVSLVQATQQGAKIGASGAGLGFYGATPVGIYTVTGTRGSRASMTSLMSALGTLGLVVDGTDANVPHVTGSRGGNTALASLLNAAVTLGLIVDDTVA